MGRKSGYAANNHWRELPSEKIGTRKGGYRAEQVAPADGQNLASCRDAYLANLAVRNYKESTITGRRRCLLYFLEWAHQRDLDDPAAITKKILESYQRHLHHYRKANGKPLSIKSQKDRLGTVQQFFSFLCRKDMLGANPASELEMPRGEKRLPKQGFSIEETREILNAPDITDPLGLRDRAMLEVLYATAIRRGELARLELSDLNQSAGTLFIRQAKGNKDRYVPTGKHALEWVERYLTKSRPVLETGSPSPALFLTTLGDGFNPDALGRLVASYIKKTLKRGGGCHLFRHSCATHMLENGADIRFIQQLLGHSKLETTSIYTQVSIKQLQQVHARTHPLDCP